MADPETTVTAIQALGAVMLGGVLGMAGQGLRAIVEIKSAKDAAKAKPDDPANLYVASRLIFGLLIGFVVGVVTTLALGIQKLATINLAQGGQVAGPLVTMLLAGYAGADAVEGLITRFIPPQQPNA